MFSLKKKFNLNLTDINKTLHSLRHQLSEELSVTRIKLKDISGTNFQLGLYHLRLGNISDAIFRFKLVTWLKPNHAEAYYYLARSLILNNKNERAKKAIDIALSLRNPWPEAQFIHDKLTAPSKINDIPEAILTEHLEYAERRLSEIAPDSPAVQRRTDLILKRIFSHIRDANPQLNVLELGTTKGHFAVELQGQNLASNIDGTTAFSSNVTRLRNLTLGSKPVYRAVFAAPAHLYLQQAPSATYDLIIADHSFDFTGQLEVPLQQLSAFLTPGGMLAFIIRIHNDTAARLFNIISDTFSFHQATVLANLEQAHYQLLETTSIAQLYEQTTVAPQSASDSTQKTSLHSLSETINIKNSSTSTPLEYLFLCKKGF